MTVFAIVMTGLSGFLIGYIFRDKNIKKERKEPKHYLKKEKAVSVEYLPSEYKNFLNYDGSEQA